MTISGRRQKHVELKSVLQTLNKQMQILMFKFVHYHYSHNLSSFRLLSKSIKIRIYETIILPVVVYGYETWSLTLREEHRLRVFENRVRRRI
jgi:hypothetical protein